VSAPSFAWGKHTTIRKDGCNGLAAWSLALRREAWSQPLNLSSRRDQRRLLMLCVRFSPSLPGPCYDHTLPNKLLGPAGEGPPARHLDLPCPRSTPIHSACDGIASYGSRDKADRCTRRACLYLAPVGRMLAAAVVSTHQRSARMACGATARAPLSLASRVNPTRTRPAAER
jgi:hypothetical protein